MLSSVTQAPAPSSPTTQMKRSSSMITPRGIEEKGGVSISLSERHLSSHALIHLKGAVPLFLNRPGPTILVVAVQER